MKQEAPTPKPNRKNRQRKANPRSTREANAEHLLLQSLSLRIGQEAARQNGIEVTDYHPIGDPREASLARLEGVGDQPIRLRLTTTVTINPKTGAVTDLHPPRR